MNTIPYYYSLFFMLFSVIMSLCAGLLFFKLKKNSHDLDAIKRQFLDYSFLDPLTKLYNYTYFSQRVHEAINQAQRNNFRVSIMKIDISLFKNVNKIYGADIGNSVLRSFGGFLKEMVRSPDVVARWEDDEFGLILNFTDKKEAIQLASRLKEMLRFRTFGDNDKKVALEVSIGVVTFPEDSYSAVTLFSFLESCLERSKEEGNRVCTFDSSEMVVSEDAHDVSLHTIDELRGRIHSLQITIEKTVLESILAFTNTIKAKDIFTAEHTESTLMITQEIGRALNFFPVRLERLKYAALLHDLGKIGIPENILMKPGKLTDEEFEVVKKHPLIGAEIIRPLHALSDLIPAILYHHERLDGRGYPYGLKGEHIPLEARIVAVADCFQALVSDRPYRKAFSLPQALAIIDQESGSHFDPKIVELFKNIVPSLDLR